ncbi:HEXXH motif domain-containing protein [Haliangium ochraceum]|uniref:HEXXH motif domain-containing protein n=1 Tax=Haliangium ochraceum (strain DSM 14365 / JCM 11303 / SMP-2) TaxID=502025 RepID=D0LR05_HALO1|nr:HEXXH motif domain-containing protein [Haliangium ochraceum]ACY15513.1 hypothetical protein Hoch_3006 [Haliangium ochraceum DSM 14365]
MDVFQYLSNPFEGDFVTLAAELAAMQYLTFCKRARRVGASVGQPEDALLDTVIEQLTQRAPSATYWTPEVGTIFTGIRQEPSAEVYAWLRAQIALSALATGVLEQVSLELDSQAPLLFAGRTFPATRLHIEGSAAQLEVTAADSDAAWSFSLAGQREGAPLWADDAGPGVFLELEGAPAVRFVGGDWHAAWGEEPCAAVVASENQRAQFSAALALLQRTMPHYFRWVTALLKEITPMQRPGEHMIASNSSALRLGGVDIATPASTTETVEMLIHECSHQYFHMASWLGTTVTPDARPHYSPLKRRERPLERILLGYHAFGNALIAFGRLVELGMDRDIDERRRTVVAYMDELKLPLADEDGISELGLALYRPLRARLAPQNSAELPAYPTTELPAAP